MPKPSEIEISLVDAAATQMDWAIRLLLDHGAPIPAITLAAASDELSGKCVASQPAKLHAHASIKEALAAKGFGEPRQVGEFMNRARNVLKHGGGDGSGRLVIEAETEAIQLIVRTIINLYRLNGSLPGEAPRFLEWVKKNRRDLMDDKES